MFIDFRGGGGEREGKRERERDKERQRQTDTYQCERETSIGCLPFVP